MTTCEVANPTEELEDPQKVEFEWEKAVTKHPDSPLMWKRYIDFSLSNFATFSLSNLRPVFAKAIKILMHQKVHAIVLSHLTYPQHQKMYSVEHPKHFLFEYRALMVVFTAACVEKQAGYEERAVAIFQVPLILSFGAVRSLKLLLEFNFNRPSSIGHDTPLATMLDFLQVRSRLAT